MEVPFGYCHCGCGQKTVISTENDKSNGWVSGVPRLFVYHHNHKLPQIEEASPFKIDGIYCRLIPLTRNLYAIVWAEDYCRLMERKWHAHYAKRVGKYYAQRDVRQKNGRYRHLPMANAVLGEPIGKIVDHKNGNPLDNRRCNLRPATRRENSWNTKARPSTKTGRRGVWPSGKKFAAVYCPPSKKKLWLGVFDTIEDAGDYYDSYVENVRGEFTCKR